MILGIDEVGRGVWAGPLVVGAVVLDSAIEGLTDSKMLSKKRREELDREIHEKAKGIGLGWVTAGEIDEIGLGSALRLATRRAVQEITTPFHEIILDGTVNFLSDTPLEKYVTTMKKADLLISSVSAASIVAKVARDRYMEEQAALYPEYGFEKHVGYGTAAHRAAIDKYGVVSLHRLSIAPLQKYQTSETLPQPSKQPRLRRIFSPFSSLSSAELASAQTSSTSKVKNGDKVGQSQIVSKTADNVSPTTRQIGDVSETAAAEELVRRGHEIIERNWKTKYCEIDIVSQKGNVLYFTEVKHRKNSKSGDGLAAITPKKLNQMKYAAKFYAHANKLENVDLRLIAIATTGDKPIVTSIIEIT